MDAWGPTRSWSKLSAKPARAGASDARVRHSNSRWRVRWIVFTYLFAFSFIAYMQRTSFSVAAVQIMPELHIDQVRWGWLLTAFLITYTIFQLPGGAFGE